MSTRVVTPLEVQTEARQLALCAVLMALLLTPTIAYTEEKVISGEASYIMGDGETPSFAESIVLQKAKQAALEEAGTYLQSYTKAKNFDVTIEEIQTITAGLLRTEVLKKSRTLVGDGVRFDIAIKATVEIEKMEELSRRIKGKNVAQEYAKLQVEYAQLSRELEGLRQSFARLPSGLDRDAALERLRDREQSYRLLQKREGQFFERLTSGVNLYEKALAQLSEKQTERNTADTIFEKVLSEGYIITLGTPDINTSLSDQKRVGLRIPVTIAINESVRSAIEETVMALGGQVLGRELVKDRIGTDSTAGVLLKIGKDPETRAHFHRRVGNQNLILQARSQDGIASTCYLPFVDENGLRSKTLGITLAAKTYSGYRLGPARFMSDEGEFIMVPDATEVATFRVAMYMPIETAKQITSLAAKVSDTLPSGANRISRCY